MAELDNGRAYHSYSVSVETPEGRLFVHIVEDENERPVKLFLNVGKSGSGLAALADATARLASRLLETQTIYEVITELSGITSDKITTKFNGEVVRSLPEGVAFALMRYREIHFRRNQPKQRPGSASMEG